MCKIEDCDVNSLDVMELNVLGQIWMLNIHFIRYCDTNAVMHTY